MATVGNGERRAVLKSEGTRDYRECKITYFTYSNGFPEVVGATPSYGVVVSVQVPINMNICIKTLVLEGTFADEKSAIEQACSVGETFINKLYDEGKISVLQAPTRIKLNNPNKKPTQSRSPYNNRAQRGY